MLRVRWVMVEAWRRLSSLSLGKGGRWRIRVAQNKKCLETQLFQAKVAARTGKLLGQISRDIFSFCTGKKTTIMSN